MKMRKALFLFAVIVLALCPACDCSRSNGREIASASTSTAVHEDGVPMGSKVGEGNAVVAEINEDAAVEAYLIADSCAGPFRIDAVISEDMQGFDITKSQEEKLLPTGETCEIPVYIYEIGNEGWVKVTPQYDAATGGTIGKTNEILVYSDLFLTDKGIGAMSSLEEFAANYPDFRIRYMRDAGIYVAETQQLKNVAVCDR